MSIFAYVGSFNYKGSEGIHICGYDKQSGKLEYIKTMYPEINASHVQVKGNLLYVTDEQQGNPEMGGVGGGRVFTFAINPENGDITELSRVHTLAANTSHITIDPANRYMIVTHFAICMPITKTVQDAYGEYHAVVEYNDTTTCLYRINQDGTPGKLCHAYIHPAKEGCPNQPALLHKTFFSTIANLYAYCNLGTDEITLFKIDYQNEKLVMLQSCECKHGSGPRHGLFHNELPYLYCNYERNGVVTSFRYGDKIEIIGDTDILPEGVEMDTTYNQAELLLSIDGKHIYDFVRGLGIAVTLGVNKETGKLKKEQSINLSSKVPRGATFSPDRHFIMIACNDTQSVLTYKIDENGMLSDTGFETSMPHPGSIDFFVGSITKFDQI